MSTMPTLKTDYIFENASGRLGVLWHQLCDSENVLASKLQSMPVGTAAVSGFDFWALRDDGGELVLVHMHIDPDYLCHEVLEGSDSRFEFDLEWVDVDEEELESYIDRIDAATLTFKTVTIPGFPVPGLSPAATPP